MGVRLPEWERKNVRLNIRLNFDLRDRARAVATMRGEDLSEKIREFVEEYVKSAEEAPRQKTRLAAGSNPEIPLSQEAPVVSASLQPDASLSGASDSLLARLAAKPDPEPKDDDEDGDAFWGSGEDD